jgi:hypothetical protein
MAPIPKTQKPTRRRELKPDSNGYYRPYVGFKLLQKTDDPKEMIRIALNPHLQQWRQHRFNLGTDKREVERRYARIQELFAESCRVAEVDEWTDFALYAATLIARGIYRILFLFDRQRLDDHQDPAAEYAQMVEICRRQHPSLEIVPEDPALYEIGRKRNKEYEIETVQYSMRPTETVLKDWGIIGQNAHLPNRVVTGMLHEALDVYQKDEYVEIELDPVEAKAYELAHSSGEVCKELELAVSLAMSQAVRKVFKQHRISLTMPHAQKVAVFLFGD